MGQHDTRSRIACHGARPALADFQGELERGIERRVFDIAISELIPVAVPYVDCPGRGREAQIQCGNLGSGAARIDAISGHSGNFHDDQVLQVGVAFSDLIFPLVAHSDIGLLDTAADADRRLRPGDRRSECDLLPRAGGW